VLEESGFTPREKGPKAEDKGAIRREQENKKELHEGKTLPIERGEEGESINLAREFLVSVSRNKLKPLTQRSEALGAVAFRNQ